MNKPEQRELLLSQLADGELPADEAGQVLLEALDDAAARQRLKEMLQLRQSLGPWRRQESPRAIVAVPPAGNAASHAHFGRRLLSLAAAAVLGGLLVAGGFLLGGLLGGGRPGEPVADRSKDSPPQVPKPPDEDRPTVFVVTPEQRREVARVFALHESVAGPLSWYAADDSSIELGAARKKDVLQQPIAVVLRLAPAGPCKQGETKTYVIVCRGDETAAIELPPPAVARTVRLRLRSIRANGEVDLQYAIAAEGSARGPDQNAALAGRRHLGLRQTSLGQLALEDCLVNVDASAWVMGEERAP